MSQRDLASLISPALLFAPGTLDATPTAIAADLRGYQSATVVLPVNAGGITFTGTDKIEFTMTHSDDNSTYTAVAQSDVRGVTVAAGGIVKSLTAAKAAADITKISYVGGKPYIKCIPVFNGSHAAGTGMAGIVERGHPLVGPAA